MTRLFTRTRLIQAGAAGVVALALGGANEFWRAGSEASKRGGRRIKQIFIRPFACEAVAMPVSVTLRGGTGVPPVTTSYYDDLGMFAPGIVPGNLDKYAAIETGAAGTYESQPGRTILYTTMSCSMEGNPIAIDAATARSLANKWVVHKNDNTEQAYGGTAVILNVGMTTFQNAFKARALNFLAANPGIDGLHFDLFHDDLRTIVGGSYPWKDQDNVLLWSTRADYANAQLAAIANVGAALKAVGKEVYVNARSNIPGDPNTDNGVNTITWMNRYYPYVTGMEVEYWEQGFQGGDTVLCDPTFTSPQPYWKGWQDVAANAYLLGIKFCPGCYHGSTELQLTRYLRASYLMEWAGPDTGWIFFGVWANEDPWNAEQAKDVGAPVGGKIAMGTRCYKREFDNYWVYINPSTTNQTLDGHAINSGDALFVAK